jgi:DNA-repair protein XRCC3
MQGVRLVVIDSITAVFRGISVESVVEAGDRTRIMFEMVNHMRILAKKYKAVFILINQMTANMQLDAIQENIPALGLAWSACVNQRYV